MNEAAHNTVAAAIGTDPGARGRRRIIVTPEGVALPVTLGQRGERAAAFLIDLLIVIGAILVLYILLFLVILQLYAGGGSGGVGWLLSGVILISFFIRSFYFAFFELRWHGATPGKRLLGLRVIDRAGGPLRPQAVLARNLMREIEVFLPISLLLSTSAGGDPWALLLTLGWVGVFVFLPLFNRDALRAGDLVAGTWVVALPKAALLRDLAESSEPPAGAAAGDTAAAGGARYVFTREQLDAYGIFELQTLETVLRNEGPQAAKVREEVAKRIMNKIGWQAGDGETVDVDRFLADFYAAQRGALERKMLFGVRRKDKHDKGKSGKGSAPREADD